jgi:hypothetical protein
MKLKAILMGFIICFSSVLTAQKTTDLIIGEQIELQSNILDTTRQLNVYLPLNYSPDSAKTYPVIYVLDGSMHEDFLHIVGLTQFGSYPWINMVPESIVVGIENVNRYHDFTYPTELEDYQNINPQNGGSADFISFIEKEVQPLIDRTYKTNAEKTIIGQSLGGLLATEILYKRPDLFNTYIIVSPSLWWDDESIFDWEAQPIPEGTNIFVGVGKEGRVMKKVAKKLYRHVKTRLTKNSFVDFEYFRRLDHGDALHLAVYEAFNSIYKKQ